MADRCIHYADGYNYQLRRTCRIQTKIIPPAKIVTKWVELDTDGILTCIEGYAWDGPSGPTIDTKTFMRASLVHDAMYQLLRLGLLPPEFIGPADEELYRICREDKMSWFRAWYSYQGVSMFGGKFADPSSNRPDQCAPDDCEPCQESAKASAE